MKLSKRPLIGILRPGSIINMTLLGLYTWLFIIFLGALLITGVIRNYSLKYSIIDIPNERSSHTHPTPRGGGLSIPVLVLITVLFLHYLQLIPFEYTLALAGGGFLVAGIGWLDDHYNLSPVWRAASYFIASIWAIFWLGGLETISIGNYLVSAKIVISFIIIIFIVWLTNLYNFMDGTDGLAASEAISVGLFSGILFLQIQETGLAIICFSIVATAAGFLYWNWAPAKIFMGDVGSCFIGFTFGVLALIGEKTGSLPVMIWIILLSVFICDATFTLIKRIVRREKWYLAHRSHSYQKLVQMNVSHSKLATAVLGLNLLVTWPGAYIAYHWKQYALYIFLLIILLMYLIWIVIQIYYDKKMVGKN